MSATCPMTSFYRFVTRGVIIPSLKMVLRQTVSGLENIPRKGSFITVANHLTDLDLLTVIRALADANVPVYSLAKSTLFKVSVLGFIPWAGGQIPVQRGTQNAAMVLRVTSEALANGGTIVILPKGTLSRDLLKQPMVVKTEAARLAMTSGAPILFMGQQGAREILDTYGRSFHPFPRKNICAIIGKLIDSSRSGQDIQDRKAVYACTVEIVRVITALVEEPRGEKAPRPFDMYYDGDPGEGKIGVHHPDPLPEADTQEENQ